MGEAENDMDKAALVLFFMGCGFLLPWNAFVMASSYFDNLYPGQHIMASLAAWNMGALVATQGLMVIFGSRFPVGFRIVTGFGLLLGALIMAIPTTTISVHLFLVVVLAVGDAVVQGSVYGFAGQISPFHTSAVMSGNGASGTICSVLGLITSGAVEDNEFAFIIFFSLCAVQICFCILAWFYMRTLAEAQGLGRTCSSSTWLKLCCPNRPQPSEVEMDGAGTGGHSAVTSEDLEENPVLELEPSSNQLDVKQAEDAEMAAIFSPRSLNKTKLKVLDDPNAEAVPMPSAVNSSCCDWYSFFALLGVIAVPAMCVCVNFVITLSVFPGLTVEFEGEGGWGRWYPMLLSTSYNVSDMFGRLVFCVYPDAMTPTKARVVWLTLPRLGFLPIFIAIGSGSVVLPELLGLLLLFLLGFTNGVASTAAMVLAPMCVQNEDGKEMASILMTFFLMSGLAVGAALGNILAESS